QAVNVVQDKELFGIHEQPNPACTVGRNIQDTIGPIFSVAELALEKALGVVTIEDVVKDILEKEKFNNQ
ncbi:transcriptional regulator, partial [Peribacillus butanolivorans]